MKQFGQTRYYRQDGRTFELEKAEHPFCFGCAFYPKNGGNCNKTVDAEIHTCTDRTWLGRHFIYKEVKPNA